MKKKSLWTHGPSSLGPCGPRPNADFTPASVHSVVLRLVLDDLRLRRLVNPGRPPQQGSFDRHGKVPEMSLQHSLHGLKLLVDLIEGHALMDGIVEDGLPALIIGDTTAHLAPRWPFCPSAPSSETIVVSPYCKPCLLWNAWRTRIVADVCISSCAWFEIIQSRFSQRPSHPRHMNSTCTTLLLLGTYHLHLTRPYGCPCRPFGSAWEPEEAESKAFSCFIAPLCLRYML